MENQQSAYKLFLDCKEETSVSFNKSQAAAEASSADEFFVNADKALDNCLALAPAAKAEVKGKDYLISAIEYSEKRMAAEKKMYNQLYSKDKNKVSTKEEEKELGFLNFSVSMIQQKEVSQWQKAYSHQENVSTGKTDPYNYLIIAFFVMAAFYVIKRINARKKNKS